MFRQTLETVRTQNEIIKRQQQEIEHKEDVIGGLVDEIDLAEKRQILNRVVRHNNANYADRWRILYWEKMQGFERRFIKMKKRLSKKLREAHKNMGKRLSGRYAQTVARRIAAFGEYEFWVCGKPKTNFGRKYVITPCMECGIGFDGKEFEHESGLFALHRIGGTK